MASLTLYTREGQNNTPREQFASHSKTPFSSNLQEQITGTPSTETENFFDPPTEEESAARFFWPFFADTSRTKNTTQPSSTCMGSIVLSLGHSLTLMSLVGTPESSAKLQTSSSLTCRNVWFFDQKAHFSPFHPWTREEQ